MTPLEALERVMMSAMASSMRYGVGRWIEKQSPEIRAALQQLTSDMTIRHRPDWIKPS